MPLIKTKFLELYNRQLNINKFTKDYWGIAAISTSIRKEVQRWEKFNTVNLKFLAKREQELLTAHCEQDAEGRTQWENPNDNVLSVAGESNHGMKVAYRGQGNLMPVFLSADDARTFNDEWVRLMNLPCDITI